MSSALVTAYINMEHARSSFEDTLFAEYPVGAPVAWMRNSRSEGHVIDHGHFDRIKVRNGATGAEYWIRAHEIVAAFMATT